MGSDKASSSCNKDVLRFVIRCHIPCMITSEILL
jgi:hypothetical protein